MSGRAPTAFKVCLLFYKWMDQILLSELFIIISNLLSSCVCYYWTILIEPTKVYKFNIIYELYTVQWTKQ